MIFPKTYMLLPLSTMGPVIELDFQIDPVSFQNQLADLSSRWLPYNPRKNIARFGMSLTSLDGGLTGVPDLDSLKEFNELNQTNYKEIDFRTPTSNFFQLPCLHPLFNYFEGHVGRAHLLRLDQGGHFPPHRDAYIEPSCFRILIPCLNSGRNDFVFLIEGQRIALEPWRAYFIDTRMEHATFSFNNNSIQLILNIAVSEDAVLKTLKKINIR